MGPASGGVIRKDGSLVCVIWGFAQWPIGGPYHQDYSTLGSILGSPYSGNCQLPVQHYCLKPNGLSK